MRTLNVLNESLFSTIKAENDVSKLPLVSQRSSRVMRQNSKSIGNISAFERKSQFGHLCYDNIQMNVAPEIAQRILMPPPLKANYSTINAKRGSNLGNVAL